MKTTGHKQINTLSIIIERLNFPSVPFNICDPINVVSKAISIMNTLMAATEKSPPLE